MKAIILARVSSKEQEEGHSIAAQTQRLKEYCQRKEMDVMRVFELVESSTRGDRKDFMAMLEYAEAQAQTVAVVADAVDRIQRSFKESVQLDELIRKEAIELHFYREGMVIGNKASASDIMRWDFSVIGAKSYVLQLSENVKRSQEYRRKNGEWSSPAPIGYLNTTDDITGKKTLMIDPLRARHVVRIFEEYATGAFSIQEMARRAESWGLRNKTKKAKPLTASQVHDMLRNPFYCGEMRINGKLYPHRYEHLITRPLYETCREIREGRSRTSAVKQTKNPFVFRGILTCAVSGRKVTSDLKKGKYVYLICRDPENPEKKLYIPESKIMKQIQGIFKGMELPEALAEALITHLHSSHDAEMEYNNRAIEALQKEDSAIRQKLDRLLDALIDGSITADTHDAKAQQLKQRQYEISIELDAHNKADDSYRITVSALISTMSRAYEIFKSSKTEQKRQLINFLFSNLQLRGEKLEYDLRSPFHLMVKPQNYQEWLPGPDSNQRPIG